MEIACIEHNIARITENKNLCFHTKWLQLPPDPLRSRPLTSNPEYAFGLPPQKETVSQSDK